MGPLRSLAHRPTMQKLLKRTAQAEKQAARRKNKRNDINKQAQQREDFGQRMAAVRAANEAVTDARRRRREDWEMGPLAPQRDTPVPNKAGTYWGSMGVSRRMATLPEKQQELAFKWAGGVKRLCLKVGDRVAIMQGPDKGKIGKVRLITVEDGTVTLGGEELQQNVAVPGHVARAKIGGENESFVRLTPLVVPVQAVRLVHPLQDPKTGITSDAIINELKPTNIVRDRPTGRVTWNRVVPGHNIQIPWPRVFEDAQREELEKLYEENSCDTDRVSAEKETYIPTLLRPPMPAEIIDELRNRYSKFRTRHDPSYLQKKEAEAAQKRAHAKGLGGAVTMTTPLQELKKKIREEKRQRPKPLLSKDMLAKIGAIMVQNSHRAPAVKFPKSLLLPAGQTKAQAEAPRKEG